MLLFSFSLFCFEGALILNFEFVADAHVPYMNQASYLINCHVCYHVEFSTLIIGACIITNMFHQFQIHAHLLEKSRHVTAKSGDALQLQFRQQQNKDQKAQPPTFSTYTSGAMYVWVSADNIPSQCFKLQYAA